MRTASWACIACGHAVAAPPTNIMNSGRPNVRPKGLERHSKGGFWPWKGAGWFGHNKLARLPRVTVGTAVASRPPYRSRRALLTHRAPPSGQTSCDERFSHARRPTRSHHSDRRGISAQCPNRGRLTAVPLG